jgi:glutamate carboxypeptidase
MNINAIASLPFDSEAMLRGLLRWVECESPSSNKDAVNRMVDLAANDFAAAGADVRRVPSTSQFGDFLRISLWSPHAQDAGILLLGHLDTVHALGRMPIRRDGDKCFGPGILDMKSGNYLVLEAFRQLRQANIEPMLPVTLLLTSDEEVGSPTSRSFIEAEARRHKYVLVPEPARADGSVVIGRYAICRAQLETRGRSTHAGNGPQTGVSAIREMAELITKVEDLSTSDATCSVGLVQGGEWTNCVSSHCSAEAIIMARSEEMLDQLWHQFELLKPRREGAAISISRGLNRPLWLPENGSSHLFEHSRQIAAGLGIDLRSSVSGGGSDGNFTGAAGIPTLDGLGACGALLHTPEEHILVSSLASRGRLLAGLLSSLS